MKRTLATIFLGALIALLGAHGAARAQVRGSRHDLTVSGAVAFNAPGPAATAQEEGVCIFCHTPHRAPAQTPLWNRRMPRLVYTPYSSSTLQASPGQPTGDSKLCLSCHDGTIALGAVLSRELPAAAMGRALSGRARLSTDLSDDHPISFDYDAALAAADPEIVYPQSLPSHIRLDGAGQMQCTSCHDSHNTGFDHFLVMDAAYSALCTSCHDKAGWSGSSHDSSPATWSGAGVDPWAHTDWTTVAANGCENCHAPHTSGSPEWLLNFPMEEDNCLCCHNGEVAQKDIAAELHKPFRHAVDAYLKVHDPMEDLASMPRHVECQDCHNPHAAVGAEAQAPYVSGALQGLAGLDGSGQRVERAEYQYQVCFRCHADEAGAPPPFIERQVVQLSVQLKTDVTNPSYHPIEGPGRNPDVPSLIFPLIESSMIYCTDCHANDAGPGAGGLGPSGPHGSSWPFLLEREYRVADGTSESYQAYALCYKCHDREAILSDTSFPSHRKHIEEERAPCSACHDPHGISATQGSPINHAHLINFDTSIALPLESGASAGRLEFVDLGDRAGECWLQCHVDGLGGGLHEGRRYGP
ncbi:MAG: hypothetical protein OEM49_01855 [Myxococcales bacterium]|nr:hypothetical protein [Myxococcales bacterium]MDH5307891.1 hypothetical protein [Myxococcales bacterium]